MPGSDQDEEVYSQANQDLKPVLTVEQLEKALEQTTLPNLIHEMRVARGDLLPPLSIAD